MIFLTGATGLVGNFLARALLQNGYKVTALKRVNSDLSLLNDIAGQITWIEGDILDMPFLLSSLKNIDTVIHSAALVSYLPKHKNLLYKINVEGTSNVVNASIENGVKNFLHISSIAALGKEKKQEVVTEDIPYTDSPSATNYSRSKYLAELEVFRGGEEGLNTCVVNPSIILGPGDWNKGSSQLFRYVWEKGSFYSSGKMNFIDVRDVCDIVLQLLPQTGKLNGEKFILNAGQTTYECFFAEIAQRFQVRKPSYEAGHFLKSIAWRVEALKSMITGKDPLITRETSMVGKYNYYYDSSKLTTLLQFRFRPLSDTLDWTCDELLKKYTTAGKLK
jgi:dihydroflavonol-4-reductase